MEEDEGTGMLGRSAMIGDSDGKVVVVSWYTGRDGYSVPVHDSECTLSAPDNIDTRKIQREKII